MFQIRLPLLMDYWSATSAVTINLHKWLEKYKGERVDTLYAWCERRGEGTGGGGGQHAFSQVEGSPLCSKTGSSCGFSCTTSIHHVTRKRLLKSKKSFTFNLSFIFGHYLLVLSEFRRRRHGWVWEIKPLALVAKSIWSQSMNSISQSWRKRRDTPTLEEEGREKEEDEEEEGVIGSRWEVAAPQWARGSVLSPPASALLTPGALWVWRCCCWMFPSAAPAPPAAAPAAPAACRASPPPQNRLWCKQLQVEADAFPLKHNQRSPASQNYHALFVEMHPCGSKCASDGCASRSCLSKLNCSPHLLEWERGGTEWRWRGWLLVRAPVRRTGLDAHMEGDYWGD